MRWWGLIGVYLVLMLSGTLAVRGRSALEWAHLVLPPGPLRENAVYWLHHHHPVTFARLLRFSDTLINVMIFLPVGWAVQHGLRSRSGFGIRTMLLVALGVGGILSIGIELLQTYVPQRIASLSDVIANSGGAVFGCYLPYFRSRRRMKP